MSSKLENIAAEIEEHRQVVMDELLKFFMTDMMFFWGEEKGLIQKQQEVWEPLLEWASAELDAKFVKTNGLNVPEENKKSGYKIRLFMEHLNDKELAAFYVAALNMKSLLLAAALVKKRIDAELAFKAAFLEEKWQEETWGSVDMAKKKQEEIKKELKDIEAFLK